MATFYVGDVWEPEDTITDPRTKAKVDPDLVIVTVTAPGLAISTPAVTRVEAGVYTARIPLTEPGKWKVAFVSTGAYKGATRESITVLPL